MAIRTRVNPGTWSVALPQKVEAKDGKITEAVAAQLHSQSLTMAKKLNGFVSLGGGDDGEWAGNIDGQYRSFLTPTANTEFLVEHGLDRIPKAYIPIRKDKAADLYDSRPDAWTKTTMYLKCSVDSATVAILIF
jgi:hypothetical protein